MNHNEVDHISNIRLRLKNDLNDKREKYRRCALDQLRGISNKFNNNRSTTEDDYIIKLGEKLKSKQHVDESVISSLQNALLESEENIVKFLKVEGALPGLIKELSGKDSRKQLLAAKCCCNISLGAPRACNILAMQASVYLITYLNSSNIHLVEVCCWTLGNIMAGCDEAIVHLEHQGVVPKLCSLLNSNQDEIVINAASYALSHYLCNSSKPIPIIELEQLIGAIQKIYFTSDDPLWLFQVLSSKLTLAMVNNQIIIDLLEKMINLVLSGCWEQNLIQLNCIVRILANFHSSPCEFLYFEERFLNVITSLLLSQYTDLCKEVMWLLGNLFNNAFDSTAKLLFFEKISPLLLNYEKSQTTS